MTTTIKFQVDVPPELNTADMNERGVRRGPMIQYGAHYGSHGWLSITRIMEAWGVEPRHEDYYLINPASGGEPPLITNVSGPRLMLRFPDGLWRYATFGGLNGPPWYYCEFTGYTGETGEIAHLLMLCASKVKQVRNLLDELKDATNEIDAMQARCTVLLEDRTVAKE